jgi:hypothetical protein
MPHCRVSCKHQPGVAEVLHHRREEKRKYSLLSDGTNEKERMHSFLNYEKTKKNKCIRSSTMKRTKKNEGIPSSTIDGLPLLVYSPLCFQNAHT